MAYSDDRFWVGEWEDQIECVVGIGPPVCGRVWLTVSVVEVSRGVVVCPACWTDIFLVEVAQMARVAVFLAEFSFDRAFEVRVFPDGTGRSAPYSNLDRDWEALSRYQDSGGS